MDSAVRFSLSLLGLMKTPESVYALPQSPRLLLIAVLLLLSLPSLHVPCLTSGFALQLSLHCLRLASSCFLRSLNFSSPGLLGSHPLFVCRYFCETLIPGFAACMNDLAVQAVQLHDTSMGFAANPSAVLS
jgi:hypothetical protein